MKITTKVAPRQHTLIVDDFELQLIERALYLDNDFDSSSEDDAQYGVWDEIDDCLLASNIPRLRPNES